MLLFLVHTVLLDHSSSSKRASARWRCSRFSHSLSSIPAFPGSRRQRPGRRLGRASPRRPAGRPRAGTTAWTQGTPAGRSPFHVQPSFRRLCPSPWGSTADGGEALKWSGCGTRSLPCPSSPASSTGHGQGGSGSRYWERQLERVRGGFTISLLRFLETFAYYGKRQFEVPFANQSNTEGCFIQATRPIRVPEEGRVTKPWITAR